jgi:hypothetical protein
MTVVDHVNAYGKPGKHSQTSKFHVLKYTTQQDAGKWKNFDFFAVLYLF